MVTYWDVSDVGRKEPVRNGRDTVLYSNVLSLSRGTGPKRVHRRSPRIYVTVLYFATNTVQYYRDGTSRTKLCLWMAAADNATGSLNLAKSRRSWQP
jgi:hypothetical protein